MIELRPYQQDCVEAIRASLDKYGSTLCVLGTGAGKTTIFCDFAKREVKRGKKVLILAHRKDLIRQGATRVYDQTGITPSIEMAGERASLHSDIVVASVSTLRTKRLAKFPLNHFGLIVIDEAHHAAASGYSRIIARFAGAELLGVTATPNRADKRCLSSVFADIAYELNLLDLTRMGFLCPIRVKSIPIEIDVSGVSMRGGDFSADELGEVIAPYLKATAEAIKEYAPGRKVLVFWPLVATSRAFARVAEDVGLSVAHIDAATDADGRKDAMGALADGRINVISNVGVMTEGVDIPCADAILIMRPTKSQPLFCQMVGRGTRLYPGKKDCLILDPLFLHEQHDLMSPASLIAATKDEAKIVTEKLKEGLSLDEAEGSAKAEIEQRLIDSLRAKAQRDPRTRTLMQLEQLFRRGDILKFEPTARWHTDPITEPQIIALEKLSVERGTVTMKGHAAAILYGAAKRRENGLATPKQVNYLRYLGHPAPESVLFADVDDEISKLKKS